MKDPLVCKICRKEVPCASVPKRNGTLNEHIRERHKAEYAKIKESEDIRRSYIEHAESIRHQVKEKYGYTFTDKVVGL